MNGIRIRKIIHAALPHPEDVHGREDVLVRITIIIQIQITHEKKRIIIRGCSGTGTSAANTNFLAPHWVGQLDLRLHRSGVSATRQGCDHLDRAVCPPPRAGGMEGCAGVTAVLIASPLDEELASRIARGGRADRAALRPRGGARVALHGGHRGRLRARPRSLGRAARARRGPVRHPRLLAAGPRRRDPRRPGAALGAGAQRRRRPAGGPGARARPVGARARGGHDGERRPRRPAGRVHAHGAAGLRQAAAADAARQGAALLAAAGAAERRAARADAADRRRRRDRDRDRAARQGVRDDGAGRQARRQRAGRARRRAASDRAARTSSPAGRTRSPACCPGPTRPAA